jgi:hypothetical protein
MTPGWWDGGGVLAAIFVLSFAAWGWAAWCWFGLRAEAGESGRRMEAVLDYVRRGERERVLALCREGGGLGAPALEWTLVAPLLDAPPEAGPDELRGGRNGARRSVRRARSLLESEANAREARLNLIGAMAAAALMLGLLGTVTGMVTTFDAIASPDRAGAARTERLAGGISEALLTTQAGLLVALPLLLAQRVLRSRQRREVARVALYLGRVQPALNARMVPPTG